jgi:hypothetical protein
LLVDDGDSSESEPGADKVMAGSTSMPAKRSSQWKAQGWLAEAKSMKMMNTIACVVLLISVIRKLVFIDVTAGCKEYHFIPRIAPPSLSFLWTGSLGDVDLLYRPESALSS